MVVDLLASFLELVESRVTVIQLVGVFVLAIVYACSLAQWPLELKGWSIYSKNAASESSARLEHGLDCALPRGAGACTLRGSRPLVRTYCHQPPARRVMPAATAGSPGSASKLVLQHVEQHQLLLRGITNGAKCVADRVRNHGLDLRCGEEHAAVGRGVAALHYIAMEGRSAGNG